MLDKPWKGYYLTAYGIAVKHGFRGTEEEWLSSLKGKPGAAAELRYNKNAKAIEWRPEGSDTWEAIVPLSELQGELVSATLSEAEEAAKSAGTAKADAMAAADAAKKDAMAASTAEKKILSHIEEYGTTVKKAYVSGDVLYIQTSDGKVFSAGDVRGGKGDTGNSGVYIGTEEPEDPEVKVWIDPSGHDGMRELINTLSRLKYTAGGVQVDLSDYAKGVDWAQNDETAANFVKNRTHYDYVGAGETKIYDCNRCIILPDVGDEVGEYKAGYYYTVERTIGANAIEVGKTYEVVFDGNTYRGVATDTEHNTVGIDLGVKNGWGSNWILLGKTGEGTVVGGTYFHNYEICVQIPYYVGDAIPPENTPLSITPIEDKVKQLDEKYIPDTIARADLSNVGDDAFRNLCAAQYVDLNRGYSKNPHPRDFDLFVAITDDGSKLIFTQNIKEDNQIKCNITTMESAARITNYELRIEFDSINSVTLNKYFLDITDTSGESVVGYAVNIKELYGVKLPK